jgi:hypothetical protein
MGLLVDRELAKGTPLIIWPAGAGRCTRWTLTAQVVHCTPQPEGGWLLGCVFDVELSAGELEELL